MLSGILQDIQGLRSGVIETPPLRAIATGVASIDAALGGGIVCGLHEWYGSTAIDVDFKARSLPIEISVHLARSLQAELTIEPWIVWVGRRCFPYPSLLATDHGRNQRLLNHSIFIDAQTPSDRLWSIEQAIGSPVVGVVVADGSRFNMAATRRIQLRAQAHATFAIVVRPPSELPELSAAQTRWLVRYERSMYAARALFVNPRWRVELLRCKGSGTLVEQRVWILELDRGTRALRLSTEVASPAADDHAARQTA